MKKYSLWVFGPAVIAVAIGALVPPAVSQAKDEWDIGAFDTCMDAAADRYMADKTTSAEHFEEQRFCCEMSGGVWSGGLCGAPPATAQSAPQAPWEAGRAPRPGTADPGQNAERTGDGTYEVVPIGPGGPVLFNP
ncbi:hypothetical protein AU192_21975 [Mycobacterium lehmannii]|uniref:Uncharacterized protein n=1 Tax=Mycobacterium lehmannii TaxID=2048550 RepID=A0A101A1B0_9MYCO|nr:hypothetical protein [Mycobacterium lehmannii]KUI10701.1 hypothetical protein AU192_21975 [Mycobacterium lehmannii]